MRLMDRHGAVDLMRMIDIRSLQIRVYFMTHKHEQTRYVIVQPVDYWNNSTNQWNWCPTALACVTNVLL